MANDVGLSDHFLLYWEVDATRAERPTVPVCSRPLRRLDIDCLKSQLSTSRLCQPEAWPADIDEMALLIQNSSKTTKQFFTFDVSTSIRGLHQKKLVLGLLPVLGAISLVSSQESGRTYD